MDTKYTMYDIFLSPTLHTYIYIIFYYVYLPSILYLVYLYFL